jgi:two-component system, cell cycle sensor histidine kinase and response regulator CckA
MEQQREAELAEQRLRQAHKMEAVGQLAGGLAHDFNNLLGVILGYCEMLEEQPGVPPPARKMILEIHNAGTSAKNLTQRLLAFSRRQVLLPVALDLNETVRRMQTMLDRLIGDDVAFTSALCPDLGTIHADPSQLEQVLMNLAINARDAMPKGGKISIATANVEIDEVHARLSPVAAPGQYVRLTVSDTGTGMDAETQSHIFEPFFSTKAPGRGTGLGLSTVFGIVKQSGGAIAVYSEPGHGTTFRVYFHRHDQAPLALEPSADLPVRGGTETILLVDDAAALRRLTRRLLQDCGYTVLESGDPADALRIAAEYPGPLPLMITDVVMPGFSGSVLAEKLAATRPETKVLYASGYSDEAVIPARMPGQDYAFLEKPFTREDLLRKVRELLDSPPPAKLSSRASDVSVAT